MSSRRLHVAIGVAAYVLSSWLAAGIWIADFWHSYPGLQSHKQCRRHQGKAIIFALGGPIALAVGYTQSGFAYHGLMWRCPERYR